MYFGGHGGWNYYRHDWKDLDNYGYNFTFEDQVGDGANTDSDWHGGIQGGLNWQSGCTVYGVQADWSWTRSTADALYRDFPLTPLATAGTLDASSQLQWFGTARTRSGIVVDNLLLYITGGLAFARFDRDFTYTSPGLAPSTQVFSEERSRWGYVLGAGTEWAMTANWSLTSEFLYMGFQKDELTFNCSLTVTCLGLPVGTAFRYEFDDSVWVSRIGLNYRFGGPAY